MKLLQRTTLVGHGEPGGPGGFPWSCTRFVPADSDDAHPPALVPSAYSPA